MNRSTEKRVLAIDPSTRGFGFAVLEGPDKLIDWGIKEARSGKNKNQQSLELVQNLVLGYQPNVIALEDYTTKRSRRCRRVRELISAIEKLAAKQKIRVCSVARSEVTLAFTSVGAVTKYQTALAITQRFPELAPRLPPVRKPWMPEDYRMPIFDAVALAVTFFEFKNKRKLAA